jgi:glucose-6-phosphate 1-epimerase
MQHGFAREMNFVPVERVKNPSFDRMIFKLIPTEKTMKIYPHKFEYRFELTLRADYLEWDLDIINLDDKPFDVTLGMHTYFDISSLKNVVISGPFTGAPTIDKVSQATGTAMRYLQRINKCTDY